MHMHMLCWHSISRAKEWEGASERVCVYSSILTFKPTETSTANVFMLCIVFVRFCTYFPVLLEFNAWRRSSTVAYEPKMRLALSLACISIPKKRIASVTCRNKKQNNGIHKPYQFLRTLQCEYHCFTWPNILRLLLFLTLVRFCISFFCHFPFVQYPMNRLYAIVH